MKGPPDTSTAGRPGRRPPLTRQRVLTAALQLVDEEGLDALTRRRLGQELDRDAMALYRHAPDRSSLLDGIVELVLDELHIPDDVPDWRWQLSRTAHDFRRLCLAHPHVISLIVTRPLSTPLGLRRLASFSMTERLNQFVSFITASIASISSSSVWRRVVISW